MAGSGGVEDREGEPNVEGTACGGIVRLSSFEGCVELEGCDVRERGQSETERYKMLDMTYLYIRDELKFSFFYPRARYLFSTH